MAKTGTHPMVALIEGAGYVQKDKVNRFHNYRYASDEAASAKMREVMSSNGLFVKSCRILRLDNSEITNGKGETLQYCVVQVGFMLSDGINDFGWFEGAGSAADKGDKAVMKAMTAARKYALAQASLLSWGDDPEADQATDEALNVPAPTEPIKTKLRQSATDLDSLKNAWESLEPEQRKLIAAHEADWWASLKSSVAEVGSV